MDHLKQHMEREIVKLSNTERKAVTMLRLLQIPQREELLAQMERQVIANRISVRVGGLRKLRIPSDKKIERAYGTPPSPVV